MYLNIFSLPDAIGPIGGLIFYGGIPPAIKMENVGRCREVEPYPPAFKESNITFDPKGSSWKERTISSRCSREDPHVGKVVGIQEWTSGVLEVGCPFLGTE